MPLTRPRNWQLLDTDFKESVRVATTENVDLNAAPTVVDGVTLVKRNRVLVKNQTNAAENGIYYVRLLGNGNNGTWLRAPDMSLEGSFTSGIQVIVEEGTLGGDKIYQLTTDNPITLNVTPLTFSLAVGGSTLDNVTDAGNVTTNGITVGSLTVDNITINGSSISTTAASIITGKLQHTPIEISTIVRRYDTAFSEYFGDDLAINDAGTVLAVGVATEEVGAATNQGGVYIYEWNGYTWIQRGSTLFAPDGEEYDLFGAGIELDSTGNTLVVSAYQWDGTATNQGGVYTFDWNGSSWVQRGSVLTENPFVSIKFGTALGLSGNGNVLVVANWNLDSEDYADIGGIYVYDRSGSNWVQRGSILYPAGAIDYTYFGSDIALNHTGTIMAVGAIGYPDLLNDAPGGVYIYDWNGSAWIQRGSVITPANPEAYETFGDSVSLSKDGKILAVGSSSKTPDGSTANGAVYIYDYDGSNWVPRGKPTFSSDLENGQQFGSAVALNGEGSILTVGAFNKGSGQGGVYTFTLTGTVPGSASIDTGAGWIDVGNLVARTAGLDRITISNTGNVNISNAVTFNNLITQASMTAPSAPAADNMAVYVTATGTSPNREIAWKIKTEDGNEIIIASILV